VPRLLSAAGRQRHHLGRGKWLAAASALLTVLPRVHALRLSIGVDGQTLLRTTRLVFVGNNEYKMHLFTQGERKTFDSGDLYLYIVKRPSRLLLLRLALLALVKDAATAESFESFRVPAFTIGERRKRRRQILVFLDGEVVRLDPPLRYRVRPRDLLVLAPPTE
jgi:diacylglycerol kinase family enzyme